MHDSVKNSCKAVINRTFDLLLAIIALLIFLPIMVAVSLAILFTMGRPILFRQIRPGLHGKPFAVYKFRTMDNAQNSRGELLADSQRLTKLGFWLRRLSLDELPQLLNVLQGDMRFVGPRPLLMEYLPLYSPEQARRHEVKPGITGWAQVNGRNAIDWQQKFKLDVWYVDHQSLLLDLKIMALTLYKVLKRNDITQPGHASMEKFRGNDDSQS